MSTQLSAANARGPMMHRRNLVLLAIAVATIVIGYVILAGGSAGVASVFLAIGYCVLFPLALIA